MGALAGALAVLLWHPVSRPCMLGAVPEMGGSQQLQTNPALLENLERLPRPRNRDERALWIEVGAQHEMSGIRLTPGQAQTIAEIAEEGARQEPMNAYWFQAQAAYLGLAGPKGRLEARAAWRRAGHCLKWDDHATGRLSSLLAGLRDEDGRTLAWHFALARYRRSPAVPRLFSRFGRFYIAEATADAALDTIRNGRLIRVGARTVEGAAEGARLIDLAATPAMVTPRDAAMARGALYDRLSALGRGEDALWTAEAFAQNDAWRSLVAPVQAAQETRRLASWSLISVAAPAGMIAAATVGAVASLLGWAVELARMPPWLRSWPASVAVGSAVGFGAYLALGLVFPALWASVLVASFGVAPDRVKEGDVVETGSGITVSAAMLALATVLAIGLSVLGWSKPGNALRGHVAPILVDTDLWREVAILTVSIVLFVAPVWGFLNRYPPSKVLPIVLRRYGMILAVAGLTGAVLVTPAAVALDLHLSGQLAKLFLNEPNYYLVR